MIVTENIKEYLLKDVKKYNNVKAAFNFDEKYNTSISQVYKFPFNFTTDEVWSIIMYDIKYYKKNNKSTDKVDILIDNLTNEHFPYVDFNRLSEKQKFHILCGMSSCFNSNDIIWFSIDEVCGYNNNDVNSEIDKLSLEMQHDIQWVMSPKTFSKMKKQLKLI